MSTRSIIAVTSDAGGVYSAYCHFDGYPEHIGKVLLAHYAGHDAAMSMVKGGDMSSIADDGAVEYLKDDEAGECVFWQEEEDLLVGGKVEQDFDDCEYMYFFDVGHWLYRKVSSEREFVLLSNYAKLIVLDAESYQ